MQENLTIARPYARAAFDTALDARAVADWETALQFLAIVVADKDMRRVISDPAVNRDLMLELLFSVLGTDLPPSFANFVKVLATARRLPVAPGIAQVFSEHRARLDNIANVEVITAYPLSSDVEQRIATAMRARLGQEIRISQTLDSSLIGGARVKVGDMVYDASIRGGLSQLANVFNLK